MATRVVNVRHKEPFDVYVGRHMRYRPDLVPLGWGNPFRPPRAIEQYREWVQTQPQLLARLGELRGKTLGCWCAPKGGLPGDLDGRVCHGEVLAALADATGAGEAVPAQPEPVAVGPRTLWDEVG